MNIPIGVLLVMLVLAVFTYASGWIWNGKRAQNIRLVILTVLLVINALPAIYRLFFNPTENSR